MDENYSIKINQTEGIIEISGHDKEWVAAQLKELKNVFNSPSQVKKIESTPAVINHNQKVQTAKTSSKKRPSSASTRAIKNPELASKLTADVKNKLDAYVKERKINFDKSLPAQAAIIATFLQDELNWDGVDQHDMYTVYSVMGWHAPGNPRAQLNNALSRNQFFGSVNEGKYTLSHKGENYARHDSKATNE
jgi:hypothetical protein